MRPTTWFSKQPGQTAPLSELRREVDRLYDAYLREPINSFAESLAKERDWAPSVDVADDDGQIVVLVEVPGIAAQDLDISVAGNCLSIAGDKKAPPREGERALYLAENRYGKFRRQVELPCLVDAGNVQAECVSGVLTIRLQKAPAASPQRIEIRTS